MISEADAVFARARSRGEPPRSLRDYGLVRVVIPTRNRPEMAVDAVRSALNQTYPNIEVVVVIDGPDPATETALANLHDPRLKILTNEVSRGGSGARNVGASEVDADWVAFLDDDDEWLPNKLETQLGLAAACDSSHVVVFSQFYAVTGRNVFVRPRRGPAPDEPLSEYLFSRRGLRAGKGDTQTSTFLASKSVVDAISWDETLRRGQDLDWSIRASQLEGCKFVFCEEPLVVWRNEPSRARIGTLHSWQESFDWAQKNRGLLTARAYAGFYLGTACREAMRTRSYGAWWRSWREAWAGGKPGLYDAMLALAVLVVPRTWWEDARALWYRVQNRRKSGTSKRT